MLAADLGSELVQCDFANEVEQCLVACEHIDSSNNQEVTDSIANLNPTEESPDLSTDLTTDANQGQPIQLDLADGSDGYFGTISPENPTQEFQFHTTDAGQVDVVIASSMGGADTILEVHDANGQLIAASQTEHLDGFQVLTFDVDADSAYELSVSSNGESEGRFQLTAGFVSIPEPVDLHADTMGSDATELTMTEGSMEMTGDLEQAGDTDVFRFTAEGNGSASLYLGDMTQTGDADLNVVVQDANGNVLTDGATNEIVMVSFDVQQDCEYFISVDANEGQTGTYSILMDVELEQPTSVDDHANEIGDTGTMIEPNESGEMMIQGELETGEDTDAFRFTSEQSGEMLLEMTASSTDHTGDAQVSIFSDEGELIVSGNTNEDVGLRLDTTAGIQYHVLVQSTNDTPTSYELKMTQDSLDPECDQVQPTVTDSEPVALQEAQNQSEESVEPNADEDNRDECDFGRIAESVFAELGEADSYESPFRARANMLDTLFSDRFERK